MLTSTSDTPTEAQCQVCKKKQSELPNDLKRCAKCKSSWYCSRDCQKADWKVHKKSCGTKSSSGSGSGGGSIPVSESPFEAIQEKRFFDGKPETEAFTQIIDSYRLRCEDEYSFMGEHRGIYNEENPKNDFKRYLAKAEKKKVLPKWWNAEKKKDCIAFGSRQGWSDLTCAVEKSDIIEHYDNNMMPMLLRMVAEMVEDSNVMGQPAGDGLRSFASMANETGDGGVMSILNMNMSGSR